VRQCIPLVVLAAVVGCSGRREPPTPATGPAPRPPSRFNPATAGSVTGRVAWVGEVPAVPPLLASIPDGAGYRFTHKPNPFAPQVRDSGLAGAVVFLRRADPAASKPWPHPPATVEQRGFELKVRQGDGPPAAVGFVQVGDRVTVVTRDPGPATVRLRGAAFATLPFPGPDRPTVRRFDTPGVVEVTSGTMLSWAACDLIVCDHPYHTVTDAAGRFALTDVPPGEYQLVCRVRNWREVGSDRDPETGLVARRRFAPPVERSAAVRVPAGGTAEYTFTLAADMFAGR
jgi:hypothetical protein